MFRPGNLGHLGRLGLVAASRSLFDPLSLFAAGEQEAWYDPSDLTTLFQDSAGTTPVTAVEQPVGLMLDKSKAPGVELVTNGSNETAVATTAGDTLASFTKSRSTDFAQTGTASAKLTSLAGTSDHYWRLYFVPAGRAIQLTGWAYLPAGATGGQPLRAIDTDDGSWNVVVVPGTSTDTWVPFTVIRQAKATAWQLTIGNNTPASWGTASIYIDNISVRELPGNHLIQPTATSRPTLSSRYNLLTKTEQFDDAVWVKTTGTTVTANSATAPDGTLTADTVAYNGTDVPGSYRIYSGTTSVSITGAGYTAKVWLRADAPVTIAIGGNTVAGVVTSVNVTTDWQQFTISGTGNGVSGVQLLIYSPAGNNAAFQVYAWGASITNASDAALPYQRVNTATDYDYDFSKFPAYLSFDGVDDSLYSAASIDFTSTDKMTVFAGVHKASDAAVGVPLEFSSSIPANNGSFGLLAPASVASNVQFASRGTALDSSTKSSHPAPVTAVYTGIGNISGDLVKLRINGVDAASDNLDQGTGNYGNYPLYVGRRNNASLPFNGRIYQLIVRGAQSSLSQIEATELYMKKKVGIA